MIDTLSLSHPTLVLARVSCVPHSGDAFLWNKPPHSFCRIQAGLESRSPSAPCFLPQTLFVKDQRALPCFCSCCMILHLQSLFRLFLLLRKNTSSVFMSTLVPVPMLLLQQVLTDILTCPLSVRCSLNVLTSLKPCGSFASCLLLDMESWPSLGFWPSWDS